ncbi:MAG: DNA polymerase III subunit delta [bacterium]
MIYAVCSTDHFRLKEEGNKLIEKLKIDDVFKFDAADTEEGDLLQELCTSSLFGQKCIVISHPIFLNSDYKFTYKQDFINYFKNPNPDIVLILLIDFIYDKNNELIKLIGDNCKIKHLANFEEKDLNTFINGVVSSNNCKIDQDAIDELIIRTKSNTLSINNELNKLMLYCDDNTIKFKDVIELVTNDLEKKLYDLTKCYFDKNQKMLMINYYDIIRFNMTKSKDPNEKKQDIHMSILHTFVNKAIDLYYVKQMMAKKFTSDQIAEKMNVKKGVAYYMTQDARKINDSTLTKLINRLSKLDYDLKTSVRDKNLAIELFLLGK